MADLSDTAIDKIGVDIDDILKTINANITRIIAKLDTNPNDTLARMELTRMRATKKAIAKEFGRFVDVANDSTNYRGVKPAIKARIKEVSFSFTQSDNAILKLLSDSSFHELSGVADQYGEKVYQSIIKGSITGSPISDITKEVTQLIEGGTDLAGRSMATHAKTIAETGYMEADRAMTLQAADNIGSDKFRYSGSLIKDSRKWCKDHVASSERSGIYTKEEIEGWRDRSWAGKKSGDPFITLGGYGCRHYLVPVLVDEGS